MADKEGKREKEISRRDMLKNAAYCALLTGVTMHILSPKAQAATSPENEEPDIPDSNYFWS